MIPLSLLTENQTILSWCLKSFHYRWLLTRFQIPQQRWEKMDFLVVWEFGGTTLPGFSYSVGQQGKAGHCGTGLTEDTGLLCWPCWTCSSFCGESGSFPQCSPSLELSHPSGRGCWSWGELSQTLCAGTAPFRWGKIVKNASCQSLVSKNSRIISNTATRTNRSHHNAADCLQCDPCAAWFVLVTAKFFPPPLEIFHLYFNK